MQARDSANAQGIDVSHWQGAIDWGKVKEAGKSFAIIKATEGLNFTDDMLQSHFTGAKSAGMGVGLYHFCRAANVEQAKAEALHFCRVLDAYGGIDAVDIAPILDMETATASSKSEISAICHVWLGIVEQRYDTLPILYSYTSFIDTYIQPTLNKYPLWLADYSHNPPKNHSGFTHWTFLQFSDRGQVPGISGPVDLNEYEGTVEQLMSKISVEDANKIIAILAGIYNAGLDPDEAHRLANELRKASGQPLA